MNGTVSSGQSYSYSVTKLHNWVLLEVTSNIFVAFKTAITSNCIGIVAIKMRKGITSNS
jgi:hypothetical protein